MRRVFRILTILCTGQWRVWPVGGVHKRFAGIGVQGVFARLEVSRLCVGGVRCIPVARWRTRPTCSTAPSLTVHTVEGVISDIS